MRHGGNLDAAVQRYAIAHGDWLDLSTGINPRAYPLPAVASASAVLTRLPSAAREALLREVARKAYGAPVGAAIAAAPGSQILIQLAARLRAGAQVAIVPAMSKRSAIEKIKGLELVHVKDVNEAIDQLA